MLEPPLGSIIRLNMIDNYLSGIWQRIGPSPDDQTSAAEWLFLENKSTKASWKFIVGHAVDIQLAHWELLVNWVDRPVNLD